MYETSFFLHVYQNNIVNPKNGEKINKMRKGMRFVIPPFLFQYENFRNEFLFVFAIFAFLFTAAGFHFFYFFYSHQDIKISNINQNNLIILQVGYGLFLIFATVERKGKENKVKLTWSIA